MKTYKPYLLAFIFFLLTRAAFSQANNAGSLIKEGIKFHDAGKYTDAIDKYKEALKLEPDNSTALYELSYSLYSSQKGKEAIPYLEKIISSKEKMGGAYDLLGNIYDDGNEPDKAIEIYRQGITIDPEYQRLHFNIGITYYRQKRYNEATDALSVALQLDPNHASSHRMYAMAAQQLNNGVDAIMAYCNFLILEPQSQRSAGAFDNIKQIISSKATKTGEKSISVTVTDHKDGDADRFAMETMLSLSAASSFESNPGKGPVDILQDQLKNIFLVAGELSSKKKNKTFFWTFYADYFYKLAKSNNMPAFTRLISLSGYKDENPEMV